MAKKTAIGIESGTSQPVEAVGFAVAVTWKLRVLFHAACWCWHARIWAPPTAALEFGRTMALRSLPTTRTVLVQKQSLGIPLRVGAS